jgi:hypothetical protein
MHGEIKDILTLLARCAFEDGLALGITVGNGTEAYSNASLEKALEYLREKWDDKWQRAWESIGGSKSLDNAIEEITELISPAPPQ